MKNQKEIFEALLAGKTLINSTAYGSIEFRLVMDCNLNYQGNFVHPENWEIKKVKVKKSKSIWVNVYKDGPAVGNYSTKESADWAAIDERIYCKEVLIEWEVYE